jgi:hypothetical protein
MKAVGTALRSFLGFLSVQGFGAQLHDAIPGPSAAVYAASRRETHQAARPAVARVAP